MKGWGKLTGVVLALSATVAVVVHQDELVDRVAALEASHAELRDRVEVLEQSLGTWVYVTTGAIERLHDGVAWSGVGWTLDRLERETLGDECGICGEPLEICYGHPFGE